MKAVMFSVPPEIVALRKRTGADRWDEMWEGILHMGPAPNLEHQGFRAALGDYLRHRWARPMRGTVYEEVNVATVGGWPDDYRIPDLALVTPRSAAAPRGEYLEGAPDVVIEIESPGDESREKLGFYAALGVPEVWIIHRDKKTPEVHVLTRGRYRKKSAGRDGWIASAVTGLELRPGKAGKLAIRLAGDDSTREDLPGA